MPQVRIVMSLSDNTFAPKEKSDNSTNSPITKKVFISYSHDSDEHCDRVASLSKKLHKDGLVTILDKDVTPNEGWPIWINNNIIEADYVIVICTKTYCKRFYGNESSEGGKGVAFEGGIIIQQLYDVKNKTLKFVPVVFSVSDVQYIPDPLRSKSRYILDRDYKTLLGFLLLGHSVHSSSMCNQLERKNTSYSPTYIAGLIDKSKQVSAFIKLKDERTKLDQPKTLGFLLTGHPKEWPDGFKYILMHKMGCLTKKEHKPTPELRILNNEDVFLDDVKASSYLWDMIAQAAENCIPTTEGIRSRLSELKSSYIFIRPIASSTRERRPEFITKLLSTWCSIELDRRSFNHYLILIYPSGDNTLGFWQRKVLRKRTLQEKFSVELEKVSLQECLLPELESPIPNNVQDWLKYHVNPEIKDAVENEIESEIKKKFKFTALGKRRWLDIDLYDALEVASESKNQKKEIELIKKFGIPHVYLRDIIKEIFEKPEFANRY